MNHYQEVYKFRGISPPAFGPKNRPGIFFEGRAPRYPEWPITWLIL
jgi:hypothetical protein